MTKNIMIKLLTIFLVVMGTSLLVAQTPTAPASPTDFSDIETFLKQNEASRRQIQVNHLNALVQKLSPLLSNDVKLLDGYKEAYITVFFEGAKKEHAKVKEWEDNNKKAFKEESFLRALRLHVQYLLASLTKRTGEDENAVKLTLQWLELVPHEADRFGKLCTQELMTAGIANSVFLRVGNQIGQVQGLANWYLGDLTNLPEIHRVNVIGFIRNKKDQQIFDQWQKNLTLEQEIANRESLESRKELFKVQRRPWLIWQIARDYAVYGQYRKAAEMMKSILQESPGCSSCEQIEGDLWRVIAEGKKAAAPPIPQ